MIEDNLVLYYPYTIAEGERADVIAHNYYGDANYAWLVYLANGMNDPVSDWPMTEDQMKRYIDLTYGSIDKAVEKIMFYRVEWASDDSMLSIAAYSSLPQALKKYWAPEYNDKRQVLHYVRTQEDWIIDTNKIVKLTLSSIDNVPAVGSYVYQLTSGSKSASGEVVNVDGLSIQVKHIVGEFSGSISAPKVLYVDDITVGSCVSSTEQANSFQSPSFDLDNQGNLTVLVDSPPMWAAEENYWVPVSAYDYETELNEAKKNIRLIDVSYLDTIERDIRQLLA